jgi:hypothetical protein
VMAVDKCSLHCSAMPRSLPAFSSLGTLMGDIIPESMHFMAVQAIGVEATILTFVTSLPMVGLGGQFPNYCLRRRC